MPDATVPPRDDWGSIHIDFFGGKSSSLWVVRCEECDEVLCPPIRKGGPWTHAQSGEVACPEVGDDPDGGVDRGLVGLLMMIPK